MEIHSSANTSITSSSRTFFLFIFLIVFAITPSVSIKRSISGLGPVQYARTNLHQCAVSLGTSGGKILRQSFISKKFSEQDVR